MAEEREYVLGTHDAEWQRLGFQHQVWASHTAALWDVARFAHGSQLLDLGCGPGYATADLAQLVGESGHVFALDVSRRFLSSLEALIAARALHNVSWHESDASAIPLPDSSIDGAFARWVLCFTPNPADVVRDVARVLKPGGRFAVLDYAHYEALTMAPRSAAVDRVVQATGRSVIMSGGDFGVGLELPQYFEEAGLDVEYLAPIVRIARPDQALWNWPGSFFRNYLPTLRSLGLITDAESLAFEQEWQTRSDNPAAYFITPTLVAIVGVKR